MIPAFALSVLCILVPLSDAAAGELTLQEALRKAQERYPTLASARERVRAAEGSVSVAQADYLPSIEAQAVYTNGFPGSARPLGIGGVMGSPYRAGIAGGLVLRQTLWDFGRTSSSVDAAEQEVELRKEDAKIARYDLFRNVAAAFYDCSRYRTQLVVSERVEKDAGRMLEEVAKFVKTGQRSVVDRYLSQAQFEEAAQTRAGYQARLQVARRRLAIMTGLAEADVTCPALPERGASSGIPQEVPAMSPLVARAQKSAEAAQARASQAKAGHYPRLVGFASVGDMEATRLVDEKNYALGVGLIIPIFDGFRVSGDVERTAATAREREYDVDSARQQISEWNARYDESIESARARLEHLERALGLAEAGFKLAKERYQSFKGSLVDLRETLRNLSRTQVQTNDTWADLLQAQAAKAFFNGAEVMASE